MGGKLTKEKEKRENKRKEEIEPAPHFILFPHFDQKTWPAIKDIISSADIKNGKQLDDCISKILQVVHDIKELQVNFFDTFDFNFIHHINNNNNNNNNENNNNENNNDNIDNRETKEEEREDYHKYFFDKTLPMMKKKAIEIETIQNNTIPNLLYNGVGKISLSQNSIVSFLSLAFFCTYKHVGNAFQDPNFTRLYFPEQIEVVKFLIHFFNRMVESDMEKTITFTRRELKKENFVDWKNCQKQFGKVEIFKEGTIEDSQADLHADFANRYLGGGVLRGGHVQEEILFMMSPDCIAGMIFCSCMEDNEVIIIDGADRYSNYSGYGRTLKFTGNYDDKYQRSNGKFQRQILAYDATLAFATGGWHAESLERDLQKAYCGFLIDETNISLPPGDYTISTGNWGCGAFGGDPILKFLQQIMAATVAGRNVLYYTFNSAELHSTLSEMYNILISNNVTIGQVHDLLTKYNFKEAEEPFHTVLKKHFENTK